MLTSYQNKEISIGPIISTKWQALVAFSGWVSPVLHECPPFQDPISPVHIALSCHVPLDSSILSFLVSQHFLVSHDFDNFEDYWPDIL